MKTVLLATIAAIAIAPAAAQAEKFVGRCKMGECIHYDLLKIRDIESSKPPIYGTLIEADMMSAVSDSPDTAGLEWDGPHQIQFFCSGVRPAIQVSDGSFAALDLVNISGATEMVVTMYLQACHPGSGAAAGDAESLNYEQTPEGTYSSFDELVKG